MGSNPNSAAAFAFIFSSATSAFSLGATGASASDVCPLDKSHEALPLLPPDEWPPPKPPPPPLEVVSSLSTTCGVIDVHSWRDLQCAQCSTCLFTPLWLVVPCTRMCVTSRFAQQPQVRCGE